MTSTADPRIPSLVSAERNRAAVAIVGGALASTRCRECYEVGSIKEALQQFQILLDSLRDLTAITLTDEQLRDAAQLRDFARKHGQILYEHLRHLR